MLVNVDSLMLLITEKARFDMCDSCWWGGNCSGVGLVVGRVLKNRAQRTHRAHQARNL